MLHWAQANGWTYDKTEACCCRAARGGHLLALQWLTAESGTMNADTCLIAAVSGHVHVLQWAVGSGCQWNARDCHFQAMRKGHVEVCNWISPNISDDAINQIVQGVAAA